MYWKIDRDYLADDEEIPSRVGFGEGTKLQAEGKILRFRLLDDDREVYYGGEADEEGLTPAFDFGQYDAGSTILQIHGKDGGWVDCIG